MVEGVGFFTGPPKYETIPSFAECCELIRQRAFALWERNGCPDGDGTEFWVAAEKELFGGVENGSYRVYVCDRSKPLNQGFYLHWDVVFVAPSGPV